MPTITRSNYSAMSYRVFAGTYMPSFNGRHVFLFNSRRLSRSVLEFDDLDSDAETPGQSALHLLRGLVERRPHREAFAAVLLSTFPLLLCVDAKAVTTALPASIPQAACKLSDKVANFLVFLQRSFGLCPMALTKVLIAN